MSKLTLRVVQGADRGKVFGDLSPPISIGREEGNTIQLNDERISRYHCKILLDNQHLVLTDLESTNGTKVNGQNCLLKILRFGDLIVVGRSVLLFGDQQQIRSRLNETHLVDASAVADRQGERDFEVDSGLLVDAARLQALEIPPAIPDRLSPSQAAQLAELLEYIHRGIGEVVEGIESIESRNSVMVSQPNWQSLLLVYSNLSELIRAIADPDFKLPG
jgi:pSer/pThr/pTyr-binding forkhead associated (FHA) protein